ncbi:N-6 DNA methylase [Leifsonia sp. RAF41]|uniref:N-6 DNA methylase n=1 Tax=Leifsonia sp. RAF41 TaxID=3233056 RepID=UPI003F9AF4B6
MQEKDLDSPRKPGQFKPETVAAALVDAGRGESLEAVVDAACDIVYLQWAEGYPAGPSDQLNARRTSDPLRSVSRHVAEQIAGTLSGFQLSSRGEFAAVFEALLALRTSNLSRAGLSYSSRPELSQLMAALVGPAPVVMDPACGFGGTLLAAASTNSRSMLYGVDISDNAARTAYRRLRLAGHDADIRVLDWLDRPRAELWDAIVVEPPFGGKLTSAREGEGIPTYTDALWLQSVAESLTREGRAVILLPDGVAFRGQDSSMTVEHLLTNGLVEAVISMPTGAVLGSNIGTCMWVLRGERDVSKAGNVLLVNARAQGQDRGGSRRYDEILRAVNPWLENSAVSDVPEWYARPVHESTLIDVQDVTPQRHLIPPPETATPRPEAPGLLLTELRLASFKSVGPPVSIPLKPLTLIYGKNSAGKSSLIQSILLLKQSIAAGRLSASGPLIDLGSVAGLAHNHLAGVPIRIGLSFASSLDIDSALALPNPRELRKVDFEFLASPERHEHELRQLQIGMGEGRFRWHPIKDDFAVLRVPVDELAQMAALAYEEHSVYPPRKGSTAQAGAVRRELLRMGFEHVDFMLDRLLVGPPTPQTLAEIRHRSSGSSRIGRVEGALRTVANLFGAVGQELEALLSRVAYLGPLREAPSRIRVRSSNTAGLDVPFFLLDNTSERAEVSERLHLLGMPYDLDAVRVSTDVDPTLFGDLAALVLTDTRTGTRLSPADVGFGISQVLPIVTELSARSRSLILIEQPEIHLHPAMQADLADLLMESADARGRSNQIIAETHSENIILRVQRRIREGAFRASDVAVIYVDQDPNGEALVSELRLDEDGDFTDAWPHGFFVERFDDVFGLSS